MKPTYNVVYTKENISHHEGTYQSIDEAIYKAYQKWNNVSFSEKQEAKIEIIETVEAIQHELVAYTIDINHIILDKEQIDLNKLKPCSFPFMLSYPYSKLDIDLSSYFIRISGYNLYTCYTATALNGDKYRVCFKHNTLDGVINTYEDKALEPAIIVKCQKLKNK